MAYSKEKKHAERQSAIVLRDAGGTSFGILHPQCATGEDFEVGQAELEHRSDNALASGAPELAKVKQRDPYTA